MKEIDQLRKKINKIDTKTIEMFAERIEIEKKIAKIKYDTGLKIINKNREKQLRKLWEERANAIGLEFKLISEVFKFVLNSSKQIQFETIEKLDI